MAKSRVRKVHPDAVKKQRLVAELRPLMQPEAYATVVNPWGTALWVLKVILAEFWFRKTNNIPLPHEPNGNDMIRHSGVGMPPGIGYVWSTSHGETIFNAVREAVEATRLARAAMERLLNTPGLNTHETRAAFGSAVWTDGRMQTMAFTSPVARRAAYLANQREPDGSYTYRSWHGASGYCGAEGEFLAGVRLSDGTYAIDASLSALADADGKRKRDAFAIRRRRRKA